ncbi:SCO7613 C-terminal domain-containing membrane protein [Agromyces sp. NPDC058484]|uniref:SCO7613 C-terminal domain-containing membrane protein n=1 Tax=Agromyces sp. NPDC058484 TaxID=3346524 RepID=UPI003656ADDD
MTDRLTRLEARDLRRWPADPAQLVDTTLCPACFSRLYSSRCIECGLELGVPAAVELLAVSTRVFEEEGRRQQVITRMREAQAAQESSPSGVPAREPAMTVASTAASRPSVPDAAAATRPQPPTPAASAPRDHDGGPRRSGVQVLLLTLGVLLISITAIVFLFVAYLVASLETRSVIIAAASVLVLGVAWMLRARRLPSTAEGVASVAVVLLLLDVWIVRANGLFGTDALNTAAYTGIAFAVMSGLLAAARALSGIRVPGYAAAALTPIAAFLLGDAIDPETATGFWFGGLVAATLAAAAVAVAPRSPERTILVSTGFAGGGVALASASWAMPDVRWSATLAFAAVAAACLLLVVAVRIARGGVAPGWGRAAAIGAGLAATLAPAVEIGAELDAGAAIWLAPASAGAVSAVLAGLSRPPARTGAEARAALIASAAVTAAASLPGLVVGAAAIGVRLIASTPPWQVAADERVLWAPAELDLGTMLVPFAFAAEATAVLLILGSLRRFAAIPIAAAIGGALVIGAIAPGAAVPVAMFVAVGAGALVIASSRVSRRVPALLPVLAVFGMTGAALAVWTGYSNVDVWPWTIAGVLAMAVAGRLRARRVWSAAAARGVGTAHLVVAVLLAIATAFTIPLWLEAAGAPLAAPFDSPLMWLGAVGAGLLAVVLFVRGISDADRIGLAVPLLAASTIAAVMAAFDAEAALDWLPAALTAVVVIVALRAPLPTLVKVLLAATGPMLLAVAFDRVLAGIPDGPPAVLGAAGAVLLAAALAALLVPGDSRAVRIAWCASLGLAGLIALASWSVAGDQQWLLLLLLAPVPILVASQGGDPIGGPATIRHLSWLSPIFLVGAAWSWLSGDGVDDVEAYTLPLAAALAAAGALVTWRRSTALSRAGGRTTLFATAAVVAVLPSVGSSGASELRTLVLVASGTVIAVAAAFLPEAARGVPIRLLGVATGWVALTGAALVRGAAVALGESSEVPVEFWPVIALAAGGAIAVIWARGGSKPDVIGEALLAASVVTASVPTLLAVVSGEQPVLRAAVLFPLLAVAHIAGAAVPVRPAAGPIFAWSTLGVLVLGGIVVLVPGEVDPFDIVTASVGVALVGAGAFRMRRSPGLGSWPALAPGLAVLMIPALFADFTDPQLWRIVALGVVAAVAVLVGTMRRLQAPLLVGGSVLLVHAIAQLWPWITWLYEAVWWWLWLGIAGVILIALAATYERQLRLARGTIRSITTLR